MADWSWFTGEPKGRCPHCSQLLRHPDQLVEWRGKQYHVGCIIDLLVMLAPAPSFYSSTDWKCP